MPKNNNLYFDYAAATPLDPVVLDAMLPYFTDEFYNPSATYLKAKKVRDDLNKARSVISGILGAKPSEIIFTAGATEANNLAIKGVLDHFAGSNVVVSAIEHESVLHPAEQYSRKHAPVGIKGIVEVDKLVELIDDKTVLVSVMYANNEIGSIQPLSEISQRLKKIRQDRQSKGIELPLYFHTDAAQAGCYLDLHVSRLGVDLMSINGGKIYGPKQSGALFVGSKVVLDPIIRGGGQERNIRSGTENVAGSIGLAKALQIAQDNRKVESSRLSELQSQFIEQLKAAIPKSIINGDLKRRLPNNVHVSLPGVDNERLLLQLEEQGILCAAGSACSASDDLPSHVLKAMGITDELSRSSLRFSLGKLSDTQAVDKAVNVLSEIY